MSNSFTKHSFYLAGQRGVKGDSGEKGDQGERGFRGFQGEKGDTGDSAYEIAVQEGFEGTKEEWIISLKGEKGDKGDQGIQGQQGLQGLQGSRGLPGEKGAIGRGVDVINVFDTVEELPKDLTEDNYGDCYIVGENLYVWGASGWSNLGSLTCTVVDEYLDMGKTIIAEATTDKGVPTSKEDSFTDMGFNIRNIFTKRPIETGSQAVMEDTKDKLYDVKKFSAILNQDKEPKYVSTGKVGTGNIVQIRKNEEYTYVLSEGSLLRVTNENGEMLSTNWLKGRKFDIKGDTTVVGYDTTPNPTIRIFDNELSRQKDFTVEGGIIDIRYDSLGRIVVVTTNAIQIFNETYEEVLNAQTVANIISFEIDNKDNMYYIGNDKKIVMLDNKGVELKVWDYKDIEYDFNEIKSNKYGVTYAIGSLGGNKCSVYKLDVDKLNQVYKDETSGYSHLEVGENNVLYIASVVSGVITKVVINEKSLWTIKQEEGKGNTTFYIYNIDDKSCELYTSTLVDYYWYLDTYTFKWELDIEGIDGTVTNVTEEPEGNCIEVAHGYEGIALFKDESTKNIKSIMIQEDFDYPDPYYNTISNTTGQTLATDLFKVHNGYIYVLNKDSVLCKYDAGMALIWKSSKKFNHFAVTDKGIYGAFSQFLTKLDFENNIVKEQTLEGVGWDSASTQIYARTIDGVDRIAVVRFNTANSKLAVIDENLVFKTEREEANRISAFEVGYDCFYMINSSGYIEKLNFDTLSMDMSIKWSVPADKKIHITPQYIAIYYNTNFMFTTHKLERFEFWNIKDTDPRGFLLDDHNMVYVVRYNGIRKTNVWGFTLWSKDLGNAWLDSAVVINDTCLAFAPTTYHEITSIGRDRVNELAILE